MNIRHHCDPWKDLICARMYPFTSQCSEVEKLERNISTIFENRLHKGNKQRPKNVSNIFRLRLILSFRLSKRKYFVRHYATRLRKYISSCESRLLLNRRRYFKDKEQRRKRVTHD